MVDPLESSASPLPTPRNGPQQPERRRDGAEARIHNVRPPPKHITIVIFALVALFTGAGAYGRYLRYRTDLRVAELAAAERAAMVEHLRTRSAQETARLQLIVGGVRPRRVCLHEMQTSRCDEFPRMVDR